MDHSFKTPGGAVSWEADSNGLQLGFRRRTKQIPWQEITAAGLVRFSDPEVPPDLPTGVLPGLGKLVDLDRRLAREQRQLALARGRSTFRAVRVPIPAGDPEATALVEAVRSKLGDRWIGEVSIQDQQAALGLSSPWWFYLLFGFGFVAFGLMILLAMGAFAALTGGQWAGVPPVAWLALLFWLLLAGGILFLYRRRG
jgi:hypothetical protein